MPLPSAGSARGYVEGVPGLNVLKGRSNWRKGTPCLLWLDEGFRKLGHLKILTITNDSLLARYRFHRSARIDPYEGPIRIDLRWQERDNVHRRPQFICPNCKSNRENLHFCDSVWLCRECHNLDYIIQKLSAIDRLFMRYDELRLKSHSIQATKSNHVRRAALYARLNQLARSLSGKERSVMPEALRHRVTGHWVDEGALEAAEEARAKGVSHEIALHGGAGR